MTLFALGLNHTTATVDVRENLAFAPDEAQRALKQACAETMVSEAAILSTCNRTEVYGLSEKSLEQISAWLAEFKGLDVAEFSACSYGKQGAEAVRHMMKVASGLDSLVLGEPQILGQMKDCYALAGEAEVLGSGMHSCFQQVFATAKRVRSETAIGENPVSVAYAAVSLAQQIFSDLSKDTALLVGAGETIELVARHLREQGIKRLLIANRTLENARRLAAEVGAEVLLIPEIPDYLADADIVISSTAAPLPLIGKGMVEQALKKRKHKMMFMVDIAVPRDIEAQVGELNDVFLYTVDDLTEVIDENRRSRQQAAELALDIVEEGVRKYEQEHRALSAVSSIKAFRTQVASLTEQELDKALKNLRSGQDPEEALKRLANNIGNKFMHGPTAAMKKAASDNNVGLLQHIKKIFSIGDVDD
ncbi:glutamyl-tRNA reductase [Agaribacterium haliotis]|uniref:glutamyl-tRNA reductase n=1 Tax=Agaribacterium haliotis TaxID=2013869 RepID=UPI000BB570EB|nr:glutamyl-tRNA reductase [Agaribacterium haliotis]